MTAVALLQSQITQEQALAGLKSAILSAPSPPEEITLDTPGTPENAFLYGLSVAEANRSDDRANYALAGYRSTAAVEWLRLHALEFFGLPVQLAGYATTSIVATNTSGNAYPSAGSYEPGELRVVNDSTKAIYENTELVAIPPAQLMPFVASITTFSVRAIDSGTASNSGVGDIDRLETALEGVTVTNPQAAQTQDDESKESINRRIDALIGIIGVEGADNLSTGGPETALESIALNGRDKGGGCLRADGSRVLVTGTKVLRDDSTGTSTLYVRDDDGPIEPADLVFVENEVHWYARRIASTVLVENVTIEVISPVAAVEIQQSTRTDAEIIAAVNSFLPAAAKAVPIGGFAITPNPGVRQKYVEGSIEAGIKSVGVTITDISVSVPGGTTLTLPSGIIQFAPMTNLTLVITRLP
jgi:hypothetical protein